jgi:hypothetical protein
MESVCEVMTGAEASVWNRTTLNPDNISSSDDTADSYQGRMSRTTPVTSKA